MRNLQLQVTPCYPASVSTGAGGMKKPRYGAGLERAKMSDLELMPKEFWQAKREGQTILAATHGRADGDGLYRLHWTKYDASDLPNDLVGLDDLKRLVIDPVDRPSI